MGITVVAYTRPEEDLLDEALETDEPPLRPAIVIQVDRGGFLGPTGRLGAKPMLRAWAASSRPMQPPRYRSFRERSIHAPYAGFRVLMVRYTPLR